MKRPERSSWEIRVPRRALERKARRRIISRLQTRSGAGGWKKRRKDEDERRLKEGCRGTGSTGKCRDFAHSANLSDRVRFALLTRPAAVRFSPLYPNTVEESTDPSRMSGVWRSVVWLSSCCNIDLQLLRFFFFFFFFFFIFRSSWWKRGKIIKNRRISFPPRSNNLLR